MLKLTNQTSDIFIPDGAPLETALRRTTHLGIGAHQDDLEFMAYHGIAGCYERDDLWFTGIICTNGSGSARAGKYADFSDEEMRDTRRNEQRRAAEIGKYSAVLQLDYPSAALRSKPNGLAADLARIFEQCAPQIVYLHNPADKHQTHINVLKSCIEALRTVPESRRPRHVYGCEVWRDLDWFPDDEKVILDSSAYPELSQELIAVFDSQIAGGKRYDLAVPGRRYANATYLNSHLTDGVSEVTFAVELTPLLDPARDLEQFTLELVDRFRSDVAEQLKR